MEKFNENKAKKMNYSDLQHYIGNTINFTDYNILSGGESHEKARNLIQKWKKETKNKQKPITKKKIVKNTKPLTALEAKRVAVAKDAIAQLKIEAYDAQSSNGFVYLDGASEDELSSLVEVSQLVEGKPAHEVELKKYITKLVSNKRPCTVCAKGALFLSSIRKYNNCSISDAVNLDKNASEKMRQFYGKANADLIEAYFERNDPNSIDVHIDNPRYGMSWSDGYDNDTERLVLILENVAKNRGIFKPNQLKWND